MDRVLLDRRNVLVALTGGAALLMLDTGAIAIDVRADGCAERFNA